MDDLIGRILELNSTDFHEGIAERVRWEAFSGQSLPFLCCFDLGRIQSLLRSHERLGRP